MNNFTVYMHINKQNGKRYIGITSGRPEDRWQNGLGYRRNKHFDDAIKKYGWNGFCHIILYSNISKERACEIERRLIALYKTTDKTRGYNITNGGEHFYHTEESKKLMSKNRKGKNTGRKSAETIAKMRANHSGGAEKKPVLCLETKKIYSCINEAARVTGINKKGISGCCRKAEHYNTAGGFHWEFANEG